MESTIGGVFSAGIVYIIIWLINGVTTANTFHSNNGVLYDWIITNIYSSLFCKLIFIALMFFIGAMGLLAPIMFIVSIIKSHFVENLLDDSESKEFKILTYLIILNQIIVLTLAILAAIYPSLKKYIFYMHKILLLGFSYLFTLVLAFILFFIIEKLTDNKNPTTITQTIIFSSSFSISILLIFVFNIFNI